MFHMTEEQKKLMYQNKRDFVEDMGFTLKAYPEFDISKLSYFKDGPDEYLRIEHRLDVPSWICVTGNSTISILKCITDDIRGQIPQGKILTREIRNSLEDKTDWEEL